MATASDLLTQFENDLDNTGPDTTPMPHIHRNGFSLLRKKKKAARGSPTEMSSLKSAPGHHRRKASTLKRSKKKHDGTLSRKRGGSTLKRSSKKGDGTLSRKKGSTLKRTSKNRNGTLSRSKNSTLKRSSKNHTLTKKRSLFRLSAQRVRTTMSKVRPSSNEQFHWSQLELKKVTDEDERGHTVPIPIGSNRAYIEESEDFDEDSDEDDEPKVAAQVDNRLVPDLQALCFHSNLDRVKEVKDSGDFDIKTPIKE